eukprot:Rmarinus@m.5217
MNIFCSTDCAQWRKYVNAYKEARDQLEKKGLSELDDWYMDDLPLLIAARQPPLLKKEELSRLMKWKLTRGSFRPRLQQLVESNPAPLVEKLSQEAFCVVLGDPSPRGAEKAAKVLTKLKGVGPATASAVLAACTEHVPFMSDEVIAASPGVAKGSYTMAALVTSTAAIQEKAKQLAQSEKEEDTKWTPRLLERALWAEAALHRLMKSKKKVSLSKRVAALVSTPNDEVETTPPGKRKSEQGAQGNHEAKSSPENDVPGGPTMKRRRTS